MAFGFDSKGRPIYYDVDRTYSQADFNELLRQLAANESIAKIDTAAIQDDLDFRGRYQAAQLAMGDNPMDWAIQQEAMQRYGGAPGVLPTQDFQQRTDPQTGETYYVRRLMSGGPGDRDNTFKLDPSMGVRENQDWYLEAIYNADGTLREIAPRERVNTSSWVEARDALKPVAAMAALVAGGNWLANALQGAGAAGAATGAPGLGGMAGQGISVAPAQGGLSAGLGTAGANAGLGINVAPAVGGLGSGLGTVGAGAGGLGLAITPGALAGFDAATGLAALAPQLPQTAQTSVLGRTGQGGTVLDRVRQIGDVAGDLAPIAGLAGLGAGAATVQPPVQPQAPTVPGAEAPPEARGYQAARDPIIDVLSRNRRQGRNRTMLTGYGGVPMESVRTGGNTLLGL